MRTTFVDRCRVVATAGRGGHGCASFFSDTRVERGPPDGGSGGDGGSVLVRACRNVTDLKLPSYNVKAAHGKHGSSEGMTGRAGVDFTLRVPLGTTVHQLGRSSITRSPAMQPFSSARQLLADLVADGDQDGG